MSIQFPPALQLRSHYLYNFVCFQHLSIQTLNFSVHFPHFSIYIYVAIYRFIFYNLNLMKLGIYVIISFCTTILDIKESEFQFQGKILSIFFQHTCCEHSSRSKEKSHIGFCNSIFFPSYQKYFVINSNI